MSTELLLEIIKAAIYPKHFEYLLKREYLEIKVKCGGVIKVIKVPDRKTNFKKIQQFGNNWKEYIKLLLTTNKVLNNFIRKIYIENEVKENEIQCFTEINLDSIRLNYFRLILEQIINNIVKQMLEMDSTDMDALRIDFVSREEFEALQEKLRVMTLKRNVAVFCCKELNTNIQGTTAEGTAEANITARYVVKRKTFVASPKNSICSLCVGDKRISPKDWFKHCQRYHPEFVVNDGYLLGRSDEVMTFCESFFAKLGLSNCHSSIIAKLLLFVDQYGNLKHGLKNLDSIALKLAADEYIFGDLQITKINEKIFSVDGIGYLGPIIASDCVNKICELASDFTYGVCFLKNTDIWNTVYFAKLISQKGYLGIIFDGSFLCVCFEEIAIKIPNSKLGTIFNDLLDFLGLTDVYYHAQGYCLIAKFVSAGNSNIKERIFRLCSGNVFPMFNKNELAYEECYAFIEGRIVYSKELYKKLVRLSRVMRIQCFPVQLAETNK